MKWFSGVCNFKMFVIQSVGIQIGSWFIGEERRVMNQVLASRALCFIPGIGFTKICLCSFKEVVSKHSKIRDLYLPVTICMGEQSQNSDFKNPHKQEESRHTETFSGWWRLTFHCKMFHMLAQEEAIALSTLVLPAPFGPISPKIDPGLTEKDTWSTATKSP